MLYFVTYEFRYMKNVKMYVKSERESSAWRAAPLLPSSTWPVAPSPARLRHRRPAPQSPPPIPPRGFTVEAAPPGDPGLGAVLVGRTVLYWLPDYGCHCRQRGTVARLCSRGPFLHVVASQTLVLHLEPWYLFISLAYIISRSSYK